MAWTPKADGNDPPTPPPRRTRRQARMAAKTGDDIPTPNLDAARRALPRRAAGARPAGGVHSSDEGVKGADDRTQISVRLGKRWSEIVMAVKTGEYTWQQFVDGLDEEELARGQLRAEDGTFSGRPPTFVPREFLLATQREQKRRFEIIFGSEVLGIAKSYIELCKSQNIPEKDRAKMMQYAMERVFGGIPKDVRISQEQPWEQMMVNVVSEEGEGMPEHLKRRYAGYKERQGEGVEEE